MDISIDYHKDHKEWKSRLNFYVDEIKFFFKELNKVFDHHKENLAWMELIDEYEAILDKKSDHIQSLLQRINEAELSLGKEANPEFSSKRHSELHLDFIRFEEKFLEMKKRFKRFASLND